MPDKHCLRIFVFLICIYLSRISATRTVKHANHSSSVKSTVYASNATTPRFSNATAHKPSVKKHVTVNATEEVKRSITARNFLYYLRRVGCSVQDEGGDNYRFTQNCQATKYLRAVKDASNGQTIDIYAKTRNTIDPTKYYISENAGLRFYERDYSYGVMTDVVNTEPIVLNEKLRLAKNGRFVLVFEEDKESTENDFIQFGSQASPGDFNGIKGLFYCNFFIKRGDDNDYDFTFNLNEKVISAREFKRVIDYNESMPLAQTRRSEIQTTDDVEVSRYVQQFYVRDEVKGYISDKGLWQLYIPSNGLYFSNNYVRDYLTRRADTAVMICSNNAFEGTLKVGCASAVIMNEAQLPFNLFTEVLPSKIRNLGFYQSNANILLTWSKVGMPFFNIPPSLNLEAYIKTSVWSDRDVNDLVYYISPGTVIRMAVENDALDDLYITRYKYMKVFFDVEVKREYVTITPSPKLNCTCKTYEKMLPPGVLKREICKLIGENMFAFDNLIISKYGSAVLKVSGAEDMVLVDERSTVKNTNFEFSQESEQSNLVEISGKGKELICGVRTELGMRRLGNTNKGYMTGSMKLFSSGDLEERCQMSFASNTVKNRHACIKQFPLMNLDYSFVFETKDSYFEFDTLLSNQTLKGQIVHCNKRQQTALALEQSSGSLADLMKVLYKDKDIDLGPLPLYSSSSVLCFQNNGRFYEKYTGAEEKEVKGAAIAKFLRENQRVPIQNDDVLIHVHNIDFNHCPEGTLGKACRFLRKAFDISDEDNILSTDLYGKLGDKGFKLSGEIDRALKLAEGITIEGSEEQPFSFDVSVQWKKVGGNYEYTVDCEFKGFICFRDIPRQENTHVLMKIKKDGLYLVIPEPYNSVHATFLGMNCASETVVRSWEYRLPEKVDYIMMNSDMNIAGIQLSARPGRTEQYVYGSKKKNKFFMCDDISKVYKVDDIYRRFNIDSKGSVLEGCQIREVCFTGYQGDQPWKIDTLNMRAKKGCWVHGVATCQRYDPRLPKKNSGPISVKIKLDGNGLVEYLEMDPILVDERINAEKKTVEYVFSMTRNEKAGNIGPYLVMEYANKFVGGSIEGYIRCPGYEGYGSLKVESLSPFKVTLKPPNATKSKRSNDPNENPNEVKFVAGFELKGQLRGKRSYEDSNLRYTINGKKLKDAIKDHYRKYMADMKTFLKQALKNCSGVYKKIEKRLEVYDIEKAAVKKRMEILSHNLDNYQREQRESEDLLRSKCSKDCNLVHTPGFKWSDNCAVSKRMSNASCLKFLKDAHVSGDVQCVAKCEVQKADTRHDIQAKARDARIQARQYSADSDLSTLLQRLDDKVGTDRKNLKGISDAESSKSKALDKMWKELLISAILTDGWQNLREVKTPFEVKLAVTVQKKWTRKYKFTFDGDLVKRVSMFYVDKRDGPKINTAKTDTNKCAIKAEVINNQIDLWKRRNKEELEGWEKRKRVEIPEHKLDREDPLTTDPHMSSLYSPKELHNDAMLKTFAPWHVLKQNDPIKTMATAKKTTTKRETVTYKNNCHATRSKLNEFSDMVAYMKTWTRAYNSGKMLQPLMKKNIDDGIKNMSFSYVKKRSEVKPRKRDELVSQWVNTLHSGFTEWGQELSRQLSAVNAMGPRIIKEELSAMFVTSPKETLESYIEASSVQADAAFKKSFVSKNKPFGDIAKNFLKHLNSDKTLEELSPLITEWDNMIRNVDKRTISCHDEL